MESNIPYTETKLNIQHINASIQNKKRQKHKARFIWPDYLHRLFIAAIFDIGLSAATPKSLLEIMSSASIAEQLTVERLKSHLQKYRINYKRSRQEFFNLFDNETQKLKHSIGFYDEEEMQSPFPIYPIIPDTHDISYKYDPNLTRDKDDIHKDSNNIERIIPQNPIVGKNIEMPTIERLKNIENRIKKSYSANELRGLSIAYPSNKRPRNIFNESKHNSIHRSISAQQLHHPIDRGYSRILPALPEGRYHYNTLSVGCHLHDNYPCIPLYNEEKKLQNLTNTPSFIANYLDKNLSFEHKNQINLFQDITKNQETVKPLSTINITNSTSSMTNSASTMSMSTSSSYNKIESVNTNIKMKDNLQTEQSNIDVTCLKMFLNSCDWEDDLGFTSDEILF